MKEELLTFDSVSFKYDIHSEKYIVKDLDLKVVDGDIISILGRSGSGKSTVLELMQGFLKPTKGKVQQNSGLAAVF